MVVETRRRREHMAAQAPAGPMGAVIGADEGPAVPDQLRAWHAQPEYKLPSEENPGAQPEVAQRYTPPSSDVPGVCVALAVIGTWAVLFWYGLFRVRLPEMDGTRHNDAPLTPWPIVAAVFLLLEHCYVGLFITTHDAMHGTIAMRHRRLNDTLGWLAISLYAWFDYRMLHKKHWEHHNHTGKVGSDPDFHQGNPAMLPWFARFMMEYSSVWQFAKIAWWATALQYLGAPFPNVLLFMTAAPLMSAFRLFYFGTYVPHHPEPGPGAAREEMGWTRSRTSSASRLLSFLSCYHFDLHWEHHRWPYAPWWELPYCRELSGRGKPSGLDKQAAH